MQTSTEKSTEIGRGSRRVCARAPGTNLCLKYYRDDDEVGATVRREIACGRFDRQRNTCAQEYDYLEVLREKLPAELLSVFPETIELHRDDKLGWCLLESLVVNGDRSLPEHFADEYRMASAEQKVRLYAAFCGLMRALEKFAVRFYDPQNVIVQWPGKPREGNDFRLRIVDFEPASRTLISLDSILPTLRRMKLRRRVRRYLRMQLGIVYELCPGAGSNALKTSVEADPISVSFCINDAYAQHLAVVIASILFHNKDSRFVFHVLHRDIRPETEARVKVLEYARPGCSILFHKIDASRFEGFPIPPALEHVTQEMYYRYILPEVLSDEKRTIYSDVDVICAGDIRPLWEMDLRGNVLAAVSEGKAGEFKKRLMGLEGDAPYFYSGLLVMDLCAMREGNYASRFLENTAKFAAKIAWPDQDIINMTCYNRILQLGPEWDGINVRYSPFRHDIRIWHFPGFTMKPWCNIWKNTTWPIYLKYLLRSPYRQNALRFVLDHIKGFFYYKYTKKGITRYLICGIRIYRRSERL